MPIDSELVHKHIRTITRINTAIAVLSLAGVLTMYAWLRWSVAPTVAAQKSTEQSNTASFVTIEQYQQQIVSLIGQYDFDNSVQAESLLYAIMEMHIPAEMKGIHLQIVIALNEAKNGQYTQAQQHIQLLRQQYAWL